MPPPELELALDELELLEVLDDDELEDDELDGSEPDELPEPPQPVSTASARIAGKVIGVRM